MKGHRWIVVLGGKGHRCSWTVCANCRLVRTKAPVSQSAARKACTSGWAE